MEIVGNRFSIKSEKIIGDKSKGSHKRALAIKFICYYCYKHSDKAGVTMTDVAIKLNRNRALIRKHYLEIDGKKKDPTAKELMKIRAELDLSVGEYLKTLKKK